MQLDHYYSKEQIIRDGCFERTMFPKSSFPSSICYAEDERSIRTINVNPCITTVITTLKWVSEIDSCKGILVSTSPPFDYYNLHNVLVENGAMALIDSPYVSEEAIIAPSAYIGKNVKISEGVEISHGAYIADNTVIGPNTYIGPYAVIGTRGLQNIKVQGIPFKVLFAGGVKIGQNCEILAHSIIQKPYQAFFTVIGDHTKISVRTSIGHGSNIGSNSMIAGNVTIAGNVMTGDNLWVGPASVISDGVKIGCNVKIILGSVVVSNIPDRQTFSGNFAMEHSKNLKNFSKSKRLK